MTQFQEVDPNGPHPRPAAPGGRRLPRRPTAAQMLYDSLRARVLSLELAPGAALSRVEIARDYGVSQTPVRDALQRLEAEGLVETFPQSRTHVSRIDLAHARETQFLRLGLELEVARVLAALPDPAAALAPASRIVEAQAAALAAGDLERFSALDAAFHRALVEAAGHPALWEVIAARSGHIDRLRALNLPDPGKPLDILSRHREILAAVAAGDRAAAEAVVRRHLSGTLQAAEAIRARRPDCF